MAAFALEDARVNSVLAFTLELAVGAGRRRVAASVDLAPGRTLVVVGPSAFGKSTLVRVIAGLARPLSGDISFGGHGWVDTARALFVPPAARRVGYVPQEQAVFPHMTVAGNVRFGADRAGRDARTAVSRAIELCDLGAIEDRRAVHLSGGERQRVAIARALASRPRLLLLDEPFCSLDDAARRALRRRVKEHCAASAIPSVLVTHDLEEAREVGDFMLRLTDGPASRPADGACAATALSPPILVSP